ncbi:hypothetical protein FGO68_gene16215 [Halteria grandinella]|uniref:Uncharacterized protein n=1 Tax=Halteria grandinella TaxID=5974 RepID=A0A8J8NCU4_HALGN|nr:hypothetical protein FGO68_gene16215 [Halteria grandinella]
MIDSLSRKLTMFGEQIACRSIRLMLEIIKSISSLKFQKTINPLNQLQKSSLMIIIQKRIIKTSLLIMEHLQIRCVLQGNTL